MDKIELVSHLKKNHATFSEFITSLKKDEFEMRPPEKWSAGQQVNHILLSIKPVSLALLLPKFITKAIIGKSNRPSKNYDELVNKYQDVLTNGGKSSKAYIPNTVSYSQKEKLIQSLQKIVEKLATQINKLTEEELDSLLLPHPLIGKITIREMIYFSIYHVEHHEASIKKNLNS